MISSINRTRFTEWLIRKNGLGEPGLKEWIFCPGMLFHAVCKWWGDKGPRNTAHEGLDICLYKDQQDRIASLDEKTRIPVMFDGVVVNIIDDFLGNSVIVEHAFRDRDTGRICTIYGHTNPLKGLYVGSGLKQGDIMGTLADPGQSGFNVMPHLHISVGLASQPISYDRLNWDTIGDSGTLALLDPLNIINWQYQILDDAIPICHNI